jgi:hypothetical protein
MPAKFGAAPSFGTHPAHITSDCKKRCKKGGARMLGWILLFGLLSLFGVTMLAAELPRPTLASMATSLLFMLLLAVSVMARVFRSRA